jgi:hypothetical protein
VANFLLMKVIALLGLLLGGVEPDRPSPDAGPMLPSSGIEEASTPPITDAPGAPEAPGSKALTPPEGDPLPPAIDEKTNQAVPPAPDKTTAPPPPQGGGAKRTEDIKPGPNGTPEPAKPPATPDPDPPHTP